MNSFLAQTAHAATDVDSLVTSIIVNIIDPIIGFLFAFAFVLFIWGIAGFLFKANDEQAREQGKQHIIYGLFGMFIMVAVMGIITLLANTFGFENPVK